MRKLVLILLFLSSALRAEDKTDLVRKAEKAYDEKHYRKAIQLYEELVDKGFVAYQLYYNLGNSYYRDNQLGKAIYNYELARKLEPSDEDVRINLAIANAKTVDKIDTRENFFISAVKTNVLSSLSTTTWAWVSVASLFLCCLLFFVYLISSKVQVKRVSFLIAGFFFLCFVGTYLLGNSALNAKYENKFGIVLSRETKVMNEPTPKATSRFALHEGTKVQVIDKNGQWLLIRLDNGNEGWLPVDHVGVI